VNFDRVISTARRLHFRIVLLIGVVVALVALGIGAPDETQALAAARPTLTVMATEPLGVSGRGFKAGERVIVSTSGKRRSVTANAAGRFVVRFSGLRCALGPIRAVGSKGSRAVTQPLKILCVHP
jgi:hypothetical protein